ncbi:PAR14-like protein [Mya arenaria]|uniref:PAR14-like protein n=1 Tax=Mya arenaria TaxID=6604 RepID=A0ABY7DYA7_MYAAR|nr:PAR14-like protein [Mya arenaria]
MVCLKELTLSSIGHWNGTSSGLMIRKSFVNHNYFKDIFIIVSSDMEGYTNEDENFTRLQLLLMKCGTPVAVELLIDRKNALSPSTYKPDPWTLHEFLKDKEDSITKRIKTQHIMKQKSILEKLFPKDQNDLNPNEWDLPLLIFVITTCCQMSSGDFIVQHLYKMKEVRNTLCHTNRPSISTAKYETMRDRVHGAIKEILNYIDNSSLRERIKEEMRKYKKDAIGSLTAFKTSLDEWFNHERQQTDILLELKEDVAKVGEKVIQVDEKVTQVDEKVIQVDEKVTQVDEKVTQVDVKVAEVLKLGEAIQTMLNVVRIGICQSDLGSKIPVPVTSAPMITISRTEEVKEAALLFISAWSDHSSKEGIQQAIHEAMTRIWGTNECVDVKLACVLFEIKCPSLEALVSLLEDCASGKLTTFVKPVETEMRKEDRWKNIELDVTLNETELKKTIDEIISEAELSRIFTSSDMDRRQLKNKIIISYALHEDVDEVKIEGALNSYSIEKIETDEENKVAVIELKDSNEAMAILQKRPVLIDNAQVQVEMFVPEPMHTVMVEFGTQDRDDPETTLNDLVVYLDGETNCYVSEETSWYDPGLDKFFVTLDDSDVAGVKSAESRDIIMLYFEDKDQSGGGDVHDVESDSENEDVIYIRFKRVDDAQEVARKRRHDVADAKLSTTLHNIPRTQRVYKDKLLIKCLPNLKNLENSIGIYLKTVGKCVVVKGSLVMHYEHKDIGMVTTEQEIGVEIVLKKGLALGKQQLKVTRYFECIGKGEDGLVLPKQTPPVKEKSSFLPSTSTVPPVGLPLHCHTTFNSTRIYAYHGDITTLSVDVIVNPSDSRLTMLGLLGKEIEKRGGREVVEECKIRVLEGPMTSTEVFVSNGGKLRAAKIAHIVTPQWGGRPEDERSILSEIVTNVLITASKTFKKIAFPAVGCGVGKFPKKIATQEIVSAAKKYLQENKETALTDLYFCDTNQDTVCHFTNAMEKEFSEGIVEIAATGQQRFQHSFPEMTHGDILEPTRHTHPSREKRSTMIDSPTRIERPAARQRRSKVCSSTQIGGITINLVTEELAKFEADVLVNSTSPNLQLKSGGGVSASISKEAGPEIEEEIRRKYPGGIEVLEFAETSGYRLKCKKCLERANLSYKSIAFPAIGTGNQGFPKDVVARVMFAAVERFARENPEPVLNVVSHSKQKCSIGKNRNALNRDFMQVCDV